MRPLAALLLLAAPALAQEAPPLRPAPPGGDPGTIEATVSEAPATEAPGAVLRLLDKITGEVRDLTLAPGETAEAGSLTVTLGECRFPSANPSGDAYALLSIRQQPEDVAVFEGWMIASAPALNALDHPRFDVWVLRCEGT